jgi:hypothetical protein
VLYRMKAKSAKETSEEEIYSFLEKIFGAKDIEHDPQVNGSKADFLVRSIDTYIEVHAVKDIASDLIEIVSRTKNVKQVYLKGEGEAKIRDRIAGKILHECNQLPDGKTNLLITKTEGFLVSPDDVMDVLIGKPHLLVDENMKKQVEHGRHAFRTEEDLQEVLQKVSAILAYDRVCEHGKLQGILGNNKNNAKVPFSEQVLATFQSMLCNKC